MLMRLWVRGGELRYSLTLSPVVAQVWTAQSVDGVEQRLLVVVTTLELDPESARYRRRSVARLSRAAREFVAASTEASGFVLMNRPKDWTVKQP